MTALWLGDHTQVMSKFQVQSIGPLRDAIKLQPGYPRRRSTLRAVLAVGLLMTTLTLQSAATPSRASAEQGTTRALLSAQGGIPKGYAPCANRARSVREAAYNCLRNWQGTARGYPSKVVYHFSSSLTSKQRAQIKIATQFALNRTQGMLDRTVFRLRPMTPPEYHVFFNIDGPNECQHLLKSWVGTRSNTWLWNPGKVCGEGYGGGGYWTTPSVPGTAAMIVSIADITLGIDHEIFNQFDFWLYKGMQHEILASFFPFSNEGILRDKNEWYSIPQTWIIYLASRAPWQAGGIQLGGETLSQYHASLLPAPGVATWVPSVADPRWCPMDSQPRAQGCGLGSWWGEFGVVPGVMQETPGGYKVMDLASQFVTAKFGPEWVQRTLRPTIIDVYTKANYKYPLWEAAGNFRSEMNEVARRLWGGKWSDLEEAIDAYVRGEWESAGVTLPTP